MTYNIEGLKNRVNKEFSREFEIPLAEDGIEKITGEDR